jgi:membrane protein|tara:strand:- start:134 stop:313 length:180 start_codon:yes stop_codon:yes gene_type:complete
MLVWLWISSFLILLGAVVNAQVEKHVYGVWIPNALSPFEDTIQARPEDQVDGTPASPLP